MARKKAVPPETAAPQTDPAELKRLPELIARIEVELPHSHRMAPLSEFLQQEGVAWTDEAPYTVTLATITARGDTFTPALRNWCNAARRALLAAGAQA